MTFAPALARFLATTTRGAARQEDIRRQEAAWEAEVSRTFAPADPAPRYAY